MTDTFFSQWCAHCIAGDYRDHVTGSHQRHVREQQQKLRECLATRFPWRWQQEPPAPAKPAQGERLPRLTSGPQIAEKETKHRQQADQ